MKKLTFIFAVIFVFSINVFSQKKPTLSIDKNSNVVLKIPEKFLSFQKVSVWSGKQTYLARISQNSSGNVLVNGESDWQRKGWAFMWDLMFKNVSRSKEGIEIELQTGALNAKLVFDSSVTDVDKAFNEVAYIGSLNSFKGSDYYKNELIEKNLPQIFSGKLSVFPQEMQLSMLEFVKFNAASIHGEDFKGKFYFSVAFTDDVVYNTIQVNQAERTAKTIEKIITGNVKSLKNLEAYPEIEGVKIEAKVFYRDFLKDSVLNTQSDEIYIYFPSDALKLYSEADITNQELVDKSVVLVNGSRVQVSMTQFK